MRWFRVAGPNGIVWIQVNTDDPSQGASQARAQYAIQFNLGANVPITGVGSISVLAAGQVGPPPESENRLAFGTNDVTTGPFDGAAPPPPPPPPSDFQPGGFVPPPPPPAPGAGTAGAGVDAGFGQQGPVLPPALGGQPIEQASPEAAFRAFLNRLGGTGLPQFGGQQQTFARQFAEERFRPTFNQFAAQAILGGGDILAEGDESERARSEAFQRFLGQQTAIPGQGQRRQAFSDFLNLGPAGGQTACQQAALNPQTFEEAQTVGNLAQNILFGSISPLLANRVSTPSTSDLFADFLARPATVGAQDFAQFNRGQLGLGALGVQPRR